MGTSQLLFLWEPGLISACNPQNSYFQGILGIRTSLALGLIAAQLLLLFVQAQQPSATLLTLAASKPAGKF